LSPGKKYELQKGNIQLGLCLINLLIVQKNEGENLQLKKLPNSCFSVIKVFEPTHYPYLSLGFPKAG